jgi:hypothetical protein
MRNIPYHLIGFQTLRDKMQPEIFYLIQTSIDFSLFHYYVNIRKKQIYYVFMSIHRVQFCVFLFLLIDIGDPICTVTKTKCKHGFETPYTICFKWGHMLHPTPLMIHYN